MAISYFGSASNPTDNGTGITAPVVITPPASMQAGDLVFVTVCFSGTSGTLSVVAGDGQTWTSLTTRNQTRNRMRSFWCVFNGTWTTNPSFTGSGTSNVIARMLVFRPDGGTSSTWVNEVSESSATYAAPVSPYSVPITGQTTTHPNCVTIAGWTSADDNTWQTITDGWTVAAPAQVRNTSGTYDQSQAHAYKILNSGGSTGDVSYRQYANAADAGTYIIISFREVQSPTTVQSIFTLTGDQPASVESGTALNVPAVIQAVGDQPTPLVNTGDTVTPAIITGTLTPLDPTMAGPRIAVADVVVAEASQVEPVVYGAAVNVPAVIAATATEPTPTLTASGVTVQSIIEGVLSQPTATPVAGDFPDATATPDAIAGQYYIANSPATEIDAIGVVAEIAAQASVTDPGYVGPTTGAVTVTPNPCDATIDQPELSLFARALVAIEAAITGLFQTLAPVLAGTLLYVAEPVLAVADQPPPTTTAGAVVTPEPITAQAATIDVVLEGQVAFSPAPITGTFSPANAPELEVDPLAVVAEVTATSSLIDPSVVLGGDTLIPILETVDALASLPTPTLNLVTVYTPEPIEGTFSQPDNAYAIGHTEVGSPVTGAFSVETPDVHPQNIVTRQDWPIPGYYEMPVPTLSISSAPILIPDALEAVGSQPEPTVTARAVVVADNIVGALEQIDPTLGTAGNITIRPAIISGELALLTPTETADAFTAPEPIDALAEPIDPAVAVALETLIPVEPIDALAGQFALTTTAEALAEVNPLDATPSLPTAVVLARALVEAEPVAGAYEMPEPSVATAGNITVRPAIITGIVSLASDAGLEIDAIAVIAEVDGTLSLPDPLVWNTPVTVEVEPVDGEFDQPTPSASATIEGVIQPSPIAGTFAVASSPAVSVSPTVVVAEVTAQGSLLVTGFGAGATIVPTPVTGMFSNPDVRIVGEVIGVTISPASIAVTGSLTFFEFSIDAELVPVPDDAAASQPTPTIALTNAPTLTQTPIVGTLSLPAPTVLAGGSVTLSLDTIDGLFSVPVVSFTEDKTVAVEPIEATASLVDPYIAIGDVAAVTVTPTPIAGTASLAEPTLTLTLQPVVALSPIDALASQVAPTLAFPWIAPALTLDTSLALPTPTILINSALIVPAPVTAIGTLHAPYIVGTAGKFKKPILKDAVHRERIYDATRIDPMQDAAERDGIIDIYLGRI